MKAFFHNRTLTITDKYLHATDYTRDGNSWRMHPSMKLVSDERARELDQAYNTTAFAKREAKQHGG